MKLTGKLTKESRSLNAALSPRSGGGGRVQDVVYGSAAGESLVNPEGVAVIPPYPTMPAVPVKGVMQGNTDLVDNNGIARVPEFPEVHQSRFVELAAAANGSYLTGTVTLSEAMTNFDLLIFNNIYVDMTTGIPAAVFLVSDIKNRFTQWFYNDYSPAWYGNFNYVDDTHVTFSRNGNCLTTSIYGVKF